MPEMKSLTLNDKTYDCFVDSVARSQVEATAVVDSASGETIALSNASNYKLLGLHIYGKTTQDGTPTPDAPVDLVSVGNRGSIETRVMGKNILPLPYRDGAAKTVNGITFLVNGDGSVSVNGTATANANFFFTNYNFVLKKGVTYTVSVGDRLTASSAYLWIATDTKETIVGINLNNARSAVFTPKNDVHNAAVYIYVDAGGSVGGVLYPQIENGAKATNYERYQAQVMSVPTPNGLPGIPVTSGGNYTDASGQQWICDEIDLARGVYIQRIYTETVTVDKVDSVDNGFVSASGAIVYVKLKNQRAVNNSICLVVCDRATAVAFNARGELRDAYRCYAPESSYTNISLRYPISLGERTVEDARKDFVGSTICYVALEPIEIPLSEEELAAYAALHTYRGNTTVTNDAGAHMELEYVMDAKKYIDSQISAGILAATVE